MGKRELEPFGEAISESKSSILPARWGWAKPGDRCQ